MINDYILDQIEDFADTFFGNQTLKEIEPLPVSGSSRRYFRIKAHQKSVIAVYNEDIAENEAFLSYSQHFHTNNAPVPEIFIVHPSRKMYLQQDLGDITLFHFLQAFRTNEQIFPEALINVYQGVIKALIHLQLVASKDLDYSVAYPRSDFDKQAIQWDLNYFKYHFLKLSDVVFDEQKLENDFDTLIGLALSEKPIHFMFRDFQSRNIMLFNQKPYFIDYQGGRRGALAYDMASLLLDAKAKLPHSARLSLLAFYKNEYAKQCNSKLNDFDNQFFIYALIRQLQALGAYGFRGIFERKQHFIDSIEPALDNLQWILSNLKIKNEIPYLSSVLESLINSPKIKSYTKKPNLKVEITSFSYKKGIPTDLSGNGGGFVFDCRSIHNPGRYDQYKTLTGKDPEVIDFLDNESEMKEFLSDVFNLVERAVRKYQQRTFKNLSVSFGCTGGQHRSVYSAEKLAQKLAKIPNLDLNLTHRESNMWKR